MPSTLLIRVDRSFRFLVPSLLILSAAANIILLVERYNLRRAAPLISAGLQDDVGRTLPPLPVLDMSGHPTLVDYGASKTPTLMYIFTPSCIWCKRNLPLLKDLASKPHPSYRLIAVSLSTDKLEDYVHSVGLRFPVYSNSTRAGALTYGFSSTPQTLLIAPSGTLLKRWRGAYLGALRQEVEQSLGIHFSVTIGSS